MIHSIVTRNPVLVLWLFVGVLACNGEFGGATTSTADSDDEESESGSTTGSGSSTSETSETATPTEGGETTTTDFCGDGKIDTSEDCDDGNMANADGCNRDCTASAALLWEYRSGLPGADSFRGIAALPDGGVVAGGAAGADRSMMRFTEEGDVVWARTYDDGSSESVLGVSISGMTIYAAGVVRPADQGIWVGTFDLEGEPGWTDVVTSEFGDAYATGISSTPEGDLIVAGLVTVEGGDANLWMRRYGPGGAAQWTQQESIQDAAQYSQGPGVSASQGPVVVGFYTTPQMSSLLLVYPPEGGAALLHQAMPTRPGSFFATTQDLGGDILTTGYIDGIGTTVDRYTAAGEAVWSTDKCPGSAGRDIEVDSQGDVVVIGDGPGTDESNIRLCKFSAAGELLWGKDIDGGMGLDFGFTLAILPGDRVAAAGQMFSGEANSFDAWLAVFAP